MPLIAATLARALHLSAPLAAVGMGVAVHRLAGARVHEVAEAMPLLSVVVIVVLVACVVALSRSQIVATGWRSVRAVVLNNGLGVGVGYGVARLAGLDTVRRRAIALEVGMQNSGLGVVLALAHFAGQPLVGLPAAIFSVWSNISAPALASYWARRPVGAGTTVVVS